MKLLIFAASHRPESLNRKLAKLAEAEALKHKATVDFAEYDAFDMPLYNDTLAATPPAAAHVFAQRAKDADGIVIALPEYNWSYPASLKNIIDWTSRLPGNPLAGKTALLMSATPGSRGGIIGLQHIKTPLEALRMHVFPRTLPLGNAENAFTDGKLTEDKQQRLLQTLVEDYLIFTRKLSS